MRQLGLKAISLAATSCGLCAITNVASASIVITEVDPFGSDPSTGYSADWFELTNTGTSAVNISGYGMIDSHTISSSNLPAALSLVGTSSIGAGQSAIFLESGANAAGSATLISQFAAAWFGSSVPAGLLIGVADTGSSYGLSQSGDAVNLFSGITASAALVASVSFGSDVVATNGSMPTFDNAAEQNNAVLATPSVAGVNGAFESASGLEIGSPGVIAPVPLPAAFPLLLSGLGLFGMARGRKTRKA